MELDHETVSGSAFLMDPPEWFPRGARALYTNFHVVEANPTKEVLLFFALLGKTPIRARVVRVYPQFDLAIIQVSRAHGAPLLNLPNLMMYEGTIPKFTAAYALGFPLGCDDVQISEGVVSGWEDSHYHLNISINSGNSGGPVLVHTPEGERVIAVSVATLCDAEAIALGIPVLFVGDILSIPQLSPHGEYPELCLESTTMARVRGPVVMNLHARDSLYSMGFRKGDIITRLGDALVDTYGMLAVSWMDIPVHWTEANLMRRCLTHGGTAKVTRHGQRVRLAWDTVDGCIPTVRTVYPFYEPIPHIRMGALVLVPFSLNLIPVASTASLTKELALAAIEPTERHTSHTVVSYIDTFSDLYVGDRVVLFDVVTHFDGAPVETFTELLSLCANRKRSRTPRHTVTLSDVVHVSVP